MNHLLIQKGDPKIIQKAQIGSPESYNLDHSNTKTASVKTTDPKVIQKRSKKVIQKPSEQAKNWLLDHPNHGLSVREAAISAKVSVGTMQRAMKNE